MSRIRRKLSYANVMSSVAVFLAVATGGAYAANTIGSSDIIDESIQSVDIKTGEVKAGDIGLGQVLGSRIADATIKTADIGDNTVSSSDLADRGTTSADIAEETVQGNDIRNGTVKGADVDERTLNVAQGGRTVAGPQYESYGNCDPRLLASHTLNVGAPTRLLVDADVHFTADGNNQGTVEVHVVVRNSSGASVGVVPSARQSGVPDTVAVAETDGVVENFAGAPLVLTAGTYTIELNGQAFGNCSHYTAWSTPRITYLRVGNSD